MRKIPEFKLKLAPSDQGSGDVIGFKYAPDYVGKRFKIGGNPDFLQIDEKVTCPSCGKEMTFYAQLDSVNDELMLADCGLIYVFICYDCYQTKSVFQSH